MPASDLLIFGIWAWVPPVLNLVILLVGIFLMLIVLIQRGKGGGLAGAFGGSGGSSAFGTRAGDQFTKITLTVALIWILLIMLMIKMIQPAPRPAVPVEVEQPTSRLGHPDVPTNGAPLDA